MEPLVRVARIDSGEPVGAQRRGEAAGELTAGVATLCRESIRRQAADCGARGRVSILVHDARGTRPNRRMVAARIPRTVRAAGNARQRREHYVWGAVTGPPLVSAGTRVAIAEPPGKLTLA